MRLRFKNMSPRAAAAFAAAVLLPSALVAQVSYAPILALDYSVTGVRGTTTNSANQDVVYTGDGPGRQGLLYVGNLFGGGTTNVLNAFGGAGTTNTILYSADTPAFNPSIGSNNIRAVGTYNTLTNGSQIFGALYTGTAAGSGTWMNLQVPNEVAGTTVTNTVPHSVMGDLVVGNFNTAGSNANIPGSGFIYNMVSSNYSMVNLPGGRITTLYGVWQNGIGSSSYTMIGGTAEPLGLTKALIVNYDSVSTIFSSLTEYVITNGADVSHFEGITGVDGGFNVGGMSGEVTNGLSTGEWFGFIATNGAGFATNVGWTSLFYPGSTSTSVDTVYGNYVMGIFIDSGAGGEQPYVATIPEPSSLALLLLGAGGLSLWLRRRA